MSGEWLRRKEAARYAKTSLRSIDEWLKDGMQHCKVGGIVLIRTRWIDEYIESHRVNAAGVDVDAVIQEVMDGLTTSDADGRVIAMAKAKKQGIVS